MDRCHWYGVADALAGIPIDATGTVVAMPVRVRLDELLPSKAAARELPDGLDRLENGEADQLVITRRNQLRAVLITVDRYEALLRAEASG